MGTCFESILILIAGSILVKLNLAQQIIILDGSSISVSEMRTDSYGDLESSQDIAPLPEDDKTLSPVIGVLSQELLDYKRFVDEPHLHIVASYVKWLEGSGAKVIPILLNQHDEYYEDVFKRTNGLLFPGGDNPIDPNKSSPMMNAAKILYRLAVKANDEGDFYPIWGTCLGFELLSVLTSGINNLSDCWAHDVNLNLKFTNRGKLFAKKSNYDGVIFDNFTDSIMDVLQHKKVTYNYHTKCLTKENFLRIGLEKFYQDLAYSTDENGLEFIAAFEAKNYPFYGVQFHPEKPAYEFQIIRSQKNIPHSWESIAASRYFSDFFVRLARKNSHIISREQDPSILIYGYSPLYTGLLQDMYEQRYLFPTN